MKTVLLGLLASAALFGQQQDQTALGPDVPRVLVFVGGSYFRVHASGAEAGQVAGVPDFELEQRNLNFNLYGWNAAVTENVTRWFGADADFSGNYGSPTPPFLCSAASLADTASCIATGKPLESIQTKLHTLTFGPRFTSHRFARLTPYFHVLVGYARISGSINHSATFLPIPTLLPQGYSKSDGALAVAPGGGLDLTLSHRIAVRLIEVDYFMTRFYGQRQDNGRASAGIVFQFGAQ